MVRKDVGRKQPHDIPPLADHDRGIEGKSACELSAQVRAAERLPNHESTRRSDVDGLKVLQLCGERRGPERSVTADVDASQKNHKCHVLPFAWPVAGS